MYLRMCLCYDAGIEINTDFLDGMQEQSPQLAPYVSQLLDKEDQTGPVTQYIDMIRKLLNVVSGNSLTL